MYPGSNRHALDNVGVMSVLASVGIFATTIQAQDFKDTDGDRPLIPRDNGTTKRLRGALRLVHRYEDGDEPDPEASEEAANDEGGPVVGASLEGNTKGEHKTGNHDTRPSSNNVSRWSSAEGA